MNNKQTRRILALVMVMLMLLCACAPGAQDSAATSASTTGTSATGTPTTNAPIDDQPETTTTVNDQPPAPGCDHCDANDDGTCDNCGGNVTIQLDFYAFNDLHGVFCDTDSNPGVDELTTYLKNAYADDSAYEIVLSSGDMWQGSVESSSNKGALMTEWMNDLGFVSMTLGNHEYDWGSDRIAENAQLAQFPFLGINVKDSNVDSPYCRNSVVVERGGVKIGIIGAIGDCLSSISGEFTDGLEFTTGNALTELVKQEATALRQQGCQFIVYSLHQGTESSSSTVQNTSSLGYYDMELSNGYVDLVFEAHTHQDYILKDSYGVYHIQAGGYNSALGYAAVSYNTVTGSHRVQTVDTLDKRIYASVSLADDPVVEELYRKYFSEEDPYADVIGYNSQIRSSYTITELVAQLYLDKGREVWGSQYEIVVGGGFLKCRTPYDLSAGDVTYSQLFSLLPFDNDLVLCRVKGEDLNQKFLQTNNSNYHCAYDDGLSVYDDDYYYIVTDTYTSSYKYNRLEEVARLKNVYARDLLKAYIADGNWGGGAEPVTIEQALQYGQMLSANGVTEKTFRVTGTITSIVNTTYGNLYIQDSTGSIYVYGLYDAGENRYDKMENKPQVGDTITIEGTITRYVDQSGKETIEFKNARLK